jgi:hypothetical protein
MIIPSQYKESQSSRQLFASEIKEKDSIITPVEEVNRSVYV